MARRPGGAHSPEGRASCTMKALTRGGPPHARRIRTVTKNLCTILWKPLPPRSAAEAPLFHCIEPFGSCAGRGRRRSGGGAPARASRALGSSLLPPGLFPPYPCTSTPAPCPPPSAWTSHAVTALGSDAPTHRPAGPPLKLPILDTPLQEPPRGGRFSCCSEKLRETAARSRRDFWTVRDSGAAGAAGRARDQVGGAETRVRDRGGELLYLPAHRAIQGAGLSRERSPLYRGICFFFFIFFYFRFEPSGLQRASERFFLFPPPAALPSPKGRTPPLPVSPRLLVPAASLARLLGAAVRSLFLLLCPSTPTPLPLAACLLGMVPVPSFPPQSPSLVLSFWTPSLTPTLPAGPPWFTRNRKSGGRKGSSSIKKGELRTLRRPEDSEEPVSERSFAGRGSPRRRSDAGPPARRRREVEPRTLLSGGRRWPGAPTSCAWVQSGSVPSYARWSRGLADRPCKRG
ncbi:uncharacterized protein LOC119545226 [Choloepus didactylus]|uniref:uncharacterized protein LOC119545226 n=1 Tax=Choloepus didactylus TaxID=27675 RepID=UPI00189E5FD4|nr:uncharacterized protein LOC119545226 [Choloepus didactylus]